MAKLEIHQFPCLKDNYGVLIHDKAAGLTAAIDAPEAEPVRRGRWNGATRILQPSTRMLLLRARSFDSFLPRR